jgi:hypothetical protein
LSQYGREGAKYCPNFCGGVLSFSTKNIQSPCGQFTSNEHMAGNCPSMLGLRQDRHNDALQLLLSHETQYWPTLVTSPSNNSPLPLSSTPPMTTILLTMLTCLPTLIDADEDNSTDSLTPCHVVLCEDLLPSSLQPHAHKADFIRLLEPMFVGHWNARRRYALNEKFK